MNRLMSSLPVDGQYHSGMLLVKLRSAPAPAPASVASFGTVGEAAALASPGMSALSLFERAGMIRRIVPLSPSAASTAAASAPASYAGVASVAGMLSARSARAEEDPLANVNLVELTRDEDVPQMQLELARDANVEQVSRVPVRYLLGKKKAASRSRSGSRAAPAATPPAASTMWNLQKIQWTEARSAAGFTDADDIKVAVLDTGIDPGHPDLEDRIAHYEWAHPDSGNSTEQDVIGHGTHVAGTIAARFDNGFGINGICTCALHIWKIFDDTPDLFDPGSPWNQPEFVYYVDPLMYRQALRGCLSSSVDVINLSIGGSGTPDFVEQELFNRLIGAGTVVVAAMGNEAERVPPSGVISYPAAIPGVIAVGATSPTDRRASFSNYRGSHISLCAPGTSIWSTLPRYAGQFGFSARRDDAGRWVPGIPQRRETDYDAWDGTSMASPHVAAAAALLIAGRGAMNGAEVKAQLEATADKVLRMNGQDRHPEYGAGRLNLYRLLQE